VLALKEPKTEELKIEEPKTEELEKEPLEYEVIFSGQTHAKELLFSKAILVVSYVLDESNVAKQQSVKEQKDAKEKIRSTIYRVNKASKSWRFLSTNTLGGPNYELYGLSPEEAREKAINNSKYWEERNWSLVQELKKTEKYLTWGNDIENHKDFGIFRKYVGDLFKNKEDKLFTWKVVMTAADRMAYLCGSYVKKNEIPPICLELIEAFERIVKYILAECAGVLLLMYMGYDGLFYLGPKVNEPILHIASTEDVLVDKKPYKLMPIKMCTIKQYRKVSNDSSDSSVVTKESKESIQIAANSTPISDRYTVRYTVQDQTVHLQHLQHLQHLRHLQHLQNLQQQHVQHLQCLQNLQHLQCLQNLQFFNQRPSTTGVNDQVSASYSG
jgi:hypothetical protein